MLSRYQGRRRLRGVPTAPDSTRAGAGVVCSPLGAGAPGAAADHGASLASPGVWSPLGAPSARPDASCRVLPAGAGPSMGVPGLCCLPGAPLATYLSRPSRASCCPAAEPGPEPAARRAARPRPLPAAWPDVGRSLAGHWLGSLCPADFEDFPLALSAPVWAGKRASRPGLTSPGTHTSP